MGRVVASIGPASVVRVAVLLMVLASAASWIVLVVQAVVGFVSTASSEMTVARAISIVLAIVVLVVILVVRAVAVLLLGARFLQSRRILFLAIAVAICVVATAIASPAAPALLVSDGVSTAAGLVALVVQCTTHGRSAHHDESEARPR